MGHDLAAIRIECELQVTEMRGLPVGLHNDGAGLLVHDGVGSAGIGMTGEQNINARYGSCQFDVGIDVALQAWVALCIRLHGSGFALVREEDDEVDLVVKFIHRTLHRLARHRDVPVAL